MTIKCADGSMEAATDTAQKNFLRCAFRILVVPSLPAAEVDQVIDLLQPEACPRQLAEYLWEHHLEELVVQRWEDLDRALERVASAFAMLDETDRCGSTVPILWIDVSQPLSCGGRRLQ